MQKKKPNGSPSALSPNCNITVITWKDERWSASLKDLEEINKLLKESNTEKRPSLFRRIINMISSLKK
jgi:hypothetical protein